MLDMATMREVITLGATAIGGAASALVYTVWQLSSFSYRLRQVEVETAQLKIRHESDVSAMTNQLEAHRSEVVRMVVQHDEHNRQDFAKLQSSIEKISEMLIQGRR
jgi:hypothetical protein